MRKVFITLIAASSMMANQSMAIEACQTVVFKTEHRELVPEKVICQKGSYHIMNPRLIVLLEPAEGSGFLSCYLPVVDAYGHTVEYGVTKIACHGSNPKYSNEVDLYYNKRDRKFDPDFNLQALVTNENGVKIIFVK